MHNAKMIRLWRRAQRVAALISTPILSSHHGKSGKRQHYLSLTLKHKNTAEPLDSAVLLSVKLVGVTRFELAASTSLRWRSSQTEPHPEAQDRFNHNCRKKSTIICIKNNFRKITLLIDNYQLICYIIYRFVITQSRMSKHLKQ